MPLGNGWGDNEPGRLARAQALARRRLAEKLDQGYYYVPPPFNSRYYGLPVPDIDFIDWKPAKHKSFFQKHIWLYEILRFVCGLLIIGSIIVFAALLLAGCSSTAPKIPHYGKILHEAKAMCGKGWVTIESYDNSVVRFRCKNGERHILVSR